MASPETDTRLRPVDRARRRPDRRRAASRGSAPPATCSATAPSRASDRRGPRRDRRDLGPVPLPRHPLGLRHVHARLLASSPGRSRRRSPTAPRSAATSARPRPRTALADRIRLQTQGAARRVVLRARALERRAGSARTASPQHGHAAALPVRLHRLLPLRRGLHAPTSRASSASRGTVVHPQHWPEDLDYAGKRVVVIGSGATAVTLVPAMAGTAAHVTMLQRSPSYVLSLPATRPAGRARAPLAARRAPPTGSCAGRTC